MNLDDYNKRDRDKDEGKARYAESEASERFSDASSLPEESAPAVAMKEGIVLPKNLNSKILMARGIALAYTGISDKETREAENDHQIVLMNRTARGTNGRVWPRRGGPKKSSANLGRVGLAEVGMWMINTTDFAGWVLTTRREKVGTHMTGAPMMGCEKKILYIRSETEKSKKQKIVQK